MTGISRGIAPSAPPQGDRSPVSGALSWLGAFPLISWQFFALSCSSFSSNPQFCRWVDTGRHRGGRGDKRQISSRGSSKRRQESGKREPDKGEGATGKMPARRGRDKKTGSGNRSRRHFRARRKGENRSDEPDGRLAGVDRGRANDPRPRILLLLHGALTSFSLLPIMDNRCCGDSRGGAGSYGCGGPPFPFIPPGPFFPGVGRVNGAALISIPPVTAPALTSTGFGVAPP